MTGAASYQYCTFYTVIGANPLTMQVANPYFVVLTARCISKAWVCDGDSDCEDNSDEDNCEALVCKLSHHMCATNDSICLPAEKLCDGTDDCPDGSDEKLCGKIFFTHKDILAQKQKCVQYLVCLPCTYHFEKRYKQHSILSLM